MPHAEGVGLSDIFFNNDVRKARRETRPFNNEEYNSLVPPCGPSIMKNIITWSRNAGPFRTYDCRPALDSRLKNAGMTLLIIYTKELVNYEP
jgi:hypothetical protein